MPIGCFTLSTTQFHVISTIITFYAFAIMSIRFNKNVTNTRNWNIIGSFITLTICVIAYLSRLYTKRVQVNIYKISLAKTILLLPTLFFYGVALSESLAFWIQSLIISSYFIICLILSLAERTGAKRYTVLSVKDEGCEFCTFKKRLKRTPQYTIQLHVYYENFLKNDFIYEHY